MAEANKLRCGQIVWATVKDHNGFRKSRPVIILTSDADIAAGIPLVVMAVTTTFTNPPPKDFIELPWNHDPRRVSTGLARRSAAVVMWLDTVYADEITDIIGTVPLKSMKQIQQRLSELGK